MKRFTRLVLVLLISGAGVYAASPAGNVAINLGTAASFGVLAGSGVTNVSSQTLITGNVGSSPTPAVTGLLATQVIGTLYLNPDPATAQAQVDLSLAYTAAASAPCGTDLTGQDLGGKTLIPGVYCFSSSALLTGALTLDGQGYSNAQWVFQIGSTLTTATGATVSLINGATKCNVFWQIGSSATIQTGNTFLGNILALTSITLNGGTLSGRALASNGAVTIAAQETIDNSGCNECTVFVTTPSTGTVTKLVYAITSKGGAAVQTVIATGSTSAGPLLCGRDQYLYIANNAVYGGPPQITKMDQDGWVYGTIGFSQYPSLSGSGGPNGLAFQPVTGSLFFSTTLSDGLSNTGVWEMVNKQPAQVSLPFSSNGGSNGGGQMAFLTLGPYAGHLVALDIANSKVVRIAPPFTTPQIATDFITTNMVGPQGLAVSSAGNIFVSNSDGTIQQFGNDGSYLGQFASTGLHNMNLTSRQDSLFVTTQEGPVIWITANGAKRLMGKVNGGAVGVAVCQQYLP